MSFYDKAKLEDTHARVRAQMTPDQRRVSDQVQAALDAENADMDRRFTEESKLRAWASDLLGGSVTISQVEELLERAKKVQPGSAFQYEVVILVKDPEDGEVRRARKTVSLYKTAFGTIDRVERYLQTLERTVIDITNNSQFTALPFRGLIKLAFNRLLKRSK